MTPFLPLAIKILLLLSYLLGLVSLSALIDQLSNLAVPRRKYFTFPAFGVSVSAFVALYVAHRNSTKS